MPTTRQHSEDGTPHDRGFEDKVLEVLTKSADAQITTAKALDQLVVDPDRAQRRARHLLDGVAASLAGPGSLDNLLEDSTYDRPLEYERPVLKGY
jgi:hypothetical protein